MRGRKIDPDFFESFVFNCIQDNKTTNNEILQEALNQLNLIDEKIKEAEMLKNKRSKLLDIISKFEKQDNSKKLQEAKYLKFFNIKNINQSKLICNKIKKSTLDISEIDEDLFLTIKQLIECKIIYKIGNCLIKGDMFEEYYDYIFGEKK